MSKIPVKAAGKEGELEIRMKAKNEKSAKETDVHSAENKAEVVSRIHRQIDACLPV